MTMDPHRPSRTFADYLVIGISPVLLMLLVGSLCFFLIQVFYRGEAVGSVRWVMFWFVFAVVLVARLGIEQGAGHASVYGIALAAATWLYLMRIHPAVAFGALLLAIVWWCANRLTRDCTLIDDDDDSSGYGLLEGRQAEERQKAEGRRQNELDDAREKNTSVANGKNSAGKDRKARRAAPHAPGKWVVYFSLAALPLFGFGQMLLPAGDAVARRSGFQLLCVYLAAAIGLLLTTSFLGLRRYLRQRHLRMPLAIAFGWVRFGVVVAVVVMVLALLLPRPGAGEAWQALRYRIDHQLRRASEYAARFGPHGKGEGREGNTAAPGEREERKPGSADQPSHSSGDRAAPAPGQTGSPGATPAVGWYRTFRFLLWLAAAVWVCWWLLRYRHLLGHMARSMVEALRKFLQNLFGSVFNWKRRARAAAEWTLPPVLSFAAFENPFVAGSDRSWSPEQVILYSYEAIRNWAAERGTGPRPEQTAREFCLELGEKFPEVGLELNQLSFLYGHAAYGVKVPEPCDLEPVRILWRYVSGVG